jgi:hypothetical protein
MSEGKDKWAKAMTERHTGLPKPDEEGVAQEVSGSDQGNEEWKAFYEAIKAHVIDMRK